MKLNSNDKNKSNEFESKIDYCFKNKKHLMLALTHSSYAYENSEKNLKSNERLEFLGDSLLSMVISEKIYNELNECSEGELSKIRSNIVCESSLVKCAEKIEIGNYLLLGKGEELSGGRKRTSILSDAIEALIASIYCDSNIDEVKRFIFNFMREVIEDSIKGNIISDYKTELQEVFQKKGDVKIVYTTINEVGPEHKKTFTVQVTVNSDVMGIGKGNSKKEAEQNAARAVLLDKKKINKSKK